MKIASKYIISFMLITTLSAASTAVVIATFSTGETEEALLAARRDQMVSLRNVASQILGQYFNSIQNQLLNVAQQQAVIDAMRSLTSSYKPFSFFVGRNDRQGQLDELKQFYSGTVESKYREINPDSPVRLVKLVEKMSEQAIALQTQYIVKNPNEWGRKDEMLQSSDNTSYTSSHRKYHPYFKSFLVRFGIHDILLVEIESGNVVYSVKKYIDFATSVYTGSFSESGLAEAFRGANQIEGPKITFSDYSPYEAALEIPIAFVSAPIYDQEAKIGVVVFALSSSNLTELLTYGYNWLGSGLGSTGETYVVGTDYKPRSASRSLIENPQEFQQFLSKLNYPPKDINRILAAGTNVGLQHIETKSVSQGLAGQADTLINRNYLGRLVLSAYMPFEVMGQRWALLNEINMDEVVSEVSSIQNTILVYAVITALIVIAFGCLVGFCLARTIIRPIQETSHSLLDIAEGEGDLTRRLNSKRTDELGELAIGFNQFVEKIHT